ncbi:MULTISPECIES: type IV pilin [Haloferax]|uniref:type IV pilin n=1 Tax=Haloferax TaxID=2251 RepID=UPI000E24D855|nr:MULTISPECIES: type IV pilin [Haloferax]RDZ34688.1 type IV pilin [Haloferax sp. Atlit-24N]RLM35098.1 type IV pilin [Haloferax sp. Atlit-109R]RLM42948.1 type IV pilin [Haloferax sp. Atlit-105R]WEL26191.1 Pilin/Flagellin, FlaG/FlaF family [Haloferax lucentense]WEL30840.1 Pilin/Flagellin, FlaG/FlaF family [Haloferax alexandrinus]
MPALAPSERRSSRGISPVVGVSLLVVIVVLLAAMVGMMVMGFEDVLSEPQPQVSFDVDYHPDGVDNGANGAYINITHEFGSIEDGSQVFVVDDANNRIAWEDVWTGDEEVGPAGEYAHIDGAGSDSALRPICEAGQRYRVVIEHEGGSSSVLVDYEIPTEPTATNAAC